MHSKTLLDDVDGDVDVFIGELRGFHDVMFQWGGTRDDPVATIRWRGLQELDPDDMRKLCRRENCRGQTGE